MVPRSAIVLLMFLVFVGGCAFEQITQEGTDEPRQGGEVEPEQSKPTVGPTPNSTPTPTPTETPPHTPTPTATATTTGPEQIAQEGLDGPKLGDATEDLCVRHFDGISEVDTSRADWMREYHIRWSPDGSRILFNGPARGFWEPVALYSVDPDGVLLQKVGGAADNYKGADRFRFGAV